MRAGKWYFINKSGVDLLPEAFDEAEDFHKGISIVRQGNLMGVVSSSATWVLKPELDEAIRLDDNILQVKKNGRMAYYNLEKKDWLWTEPGYQK
jgi:hypothetical protein